MNRSLLESLVLVALFSLLTFALVRPLYTLGQAGLAKPLQQAATRGPGVRLMSFSRAEELGAGNLLSEPQLNADGSKVLIHRKYKAEAELAVWTEGAGVEVLPLSRGTLSATSISGRGESVAFLLADSSVAEPSSTSPSMLGIWQQGLGTSIQSDLHYLGDWKLNISRDGERIVLLPATAEASVVDATSDATSRSGFVFEKTKDASWKREAFAQAFSAQGLAAERDGFSVLSAQNEIGFLRRFRRKAGALVFDANGDGAEDLLSLSQAANQSPLWQSYSLSGFRSLRHEASAEEAILASWQLGYPASVPVPADYDGDGVLDFANYLPGFYPGQLGARGNWTLFFSKKGRQAISPLSSREHAWGFGDMKAVPADYDGDGAADLAVVATASSRWHLLYSRGDFNRTKADLGGDSYYGEKIQWGLPGDCLVPGDYNADSCADLSVVRVDAEGKMRWLLRPMPCRGERADAVSEIAFGRRGDIPIPADYNGDGSLQVAVYRPSEQRWFIRGKDDSVTKIKWGLEGAAPFVGDFDGDAKADFAFYDADGPEHYLLRLSTVSAETNRALGAASPGVRRLRWGSADAQPVQLLRRKHLGCEFKTQSE